MAQRGSEGRGGGVGGRMRAIIEKQRSWRKNREEGRHRRKVIANAPDSFAPIDEETDGKAVETQPPKDEAQHRFLSVALRAHFLFSSLEEEDVARILESMQRMEAAAGQQVIRQGDNGTEFFVLETGTADIFVNSEKVGEYEGGACFGELALMYNAKRAATITTTSDCVLWTLGLRTFRRILATTSSARMVARCDFLKRVPLLQPLSNDQVTKVAGALSEISFEASTRIIQQGEHGDTFYIIEDGQVKCSHRKAEHDATETDLISLGAGDYFGEMALMLDEPRHANVDAISNTKCLTLEKSTFLELLGPLNEILSRQMRIRILRSVPLLADLLDDELDTIANAMRVQVFEDGEYIITEGEEGSRFFIINEGEVLCTKNDPAAEGGQRELMRLSNQEYFGERALVREEPRKANVLAVGRVECLVLDRDEFHGLLGNLRTRIEKELKRRETIGRKADGRQTAREEASEAARKRREEMAVNFSELSPVRTIGTGTFGRVKLVQHAPTSRVMALKCMHKAQIVSSHQERNIMNEKNILMQCQHPFVLELIQTFNSPNQLFMLMEIIQGGELWSYIYERFDCIPRTSLGGFPVHAAMFYSGCVISAFNYIHSLGVAYRDLKPENLLLDSQGFLKIIDFGFAKSIPFKKGNSIHTKSFTLCGTPEYLAPELVLSRGHDKAVDYWALGCLLFELLVGRTPFQDDHQPEIFKKIIHSDRSLHFPRGFDATAADLIRRLLTPNPVFRLGSLSGGVRDIMSHRWFSTNGFDWNALEARELEAPFTPPLDDPLDTQHYDHYPEDDHVPRYTGPQHIFESF